MDRLMEARAKELNGDTGAFLREAKSISRDAGDFNPDQYLDSRRYPVGTQIVVSADGTVKHLFPDGTTEMVYTADGGIVPYTGGNMIHTGNYGSTGRTS